MSARRPLGRLLAAASLAAASLVRLPARTKGSVTIPDATPGNPNPAGLAAADVELPPLADIEAAAARYDRAGEQARAADRSKRAARKILDRLPAGTYGAWRIERVANAREVADLEAIRAIFTANGLGPIPVKSSAPSLKVTRVQVAAAPGAVEPELSMLAGAR